jgi:SAM-dependent methyltransferase
LQDGKCSLLGFKFGVTIVTNDYFFELDICSMNTDKQKYWETIYETKGPEDVSWTEKIPATSLNLINQLQLSKNESIIDVGGGDSNLVDFLLEAGYKNLTVLDISENALARAKNRLGEKAKKVKWIVADILTYTQLQHFDVWHDRAAFHFLTQPQEVNAYVTKVNTFVTGHLILGTFSVNGPLKCSGLPITQYTPELVKPLFENAFSLKGCINKDHITPFGTEQNFLFCVFNKSKPDAMH